MNTMQSCPRENHVKSQGKSFDKKKKIGIGHDQW